jgi:hypothetical protein
MGLSFTIATDPRQRCRSHVRVPRDSWSYFTISDSRLSQPGALGPRVYIYPTGTRWPTYIPTHWVPFSSPPTTRRDAVEVFEPASTRDPRLTQLPPTCSACKPSARTNIKHISAIFADVTWERTLFAESPVSSGSTCYNILKTGRQQR